MMRQLTILIPTYNRRERLFNTLTSINKQGHQGEYDIIISDNHSEYDVQEMINNEFDPDFARGIQVIRWGFNMGMATNLSVPFTFVKTPWCWLISDDDEIFDNALSVLFNEIGKKDSHSVAAVKHSTTILAEHAENKDFDSVRDICNYYIQTFNSRSDRWYLTMLYNMNVLKPYLSDFTLYSYSALSFWIPVIRAVNDKAGVLRISKDILIGYHDCAEDGWFTNPKRYLKTLVQIRTIFDSFHGLDYESYMLFRKMILGDNSDFRVRTVVNLICQCEKNYERRYYYNLLNEYMVGGIISKFMYKSFYYFVCFFNISPQQIRKFRKSILK